MQNHKMLSRLLVAALISLTSVAAVQAADASTSAAANSTTATGASTDTGAAPLGAGSATTAVGATSAYADDAMITTMVKAALVEDKQVQSLKISVSTEKGVVKMSGVVPTAEVGQRALQLAAGVQGVQDIKSELKVKKES